MKILSFFRGVNALLIFIPVSLVCEYALHKPLWVFITAGLAIVPLAAVMGEATEELSKCLGPQWGGLLNATFGNATELIIGLFGLHAGLIDLVRASIIGSVIGNILLVLGASVLVGGIRNGVQDFNKDHARTHALNLLLAVMSLAVPAIFAQAYGTVKSASNPAIVHLSVGVSLLLLLVYVISLAFSLRLRQPLFREGELVDGCYETPNWSVRRALAILAAATVAVAFESELLVDSVRGATVALGANDVFVGIIIIPIIGNAAEHSTAVLLAWRNKIDVTMNIAIGSSTQVAMFVAPFLVLASFFLGHRMTYIFSVPELTATGFAVFIAAFISNDGKSHWLEGAQLLAAYMILALSFYFLPLQ